jgi:fused signal recognition particle receptor
MPREWTELFVTDGVRVAVPAVTEEAPARRRGFFRRLRENMSKTREALGAEIQATLFEGDVDEETWERLEEALIMADVGAQTTAKVVGQLELEADRGDLVGGEALSARLQELLADLARLGDPTIDLRHGPTVIMAVGVNGTGKTTTIGKLAWHLQRELGPVRRPRRRRHVPRGGPRAARGLGGRAGCDIVTGRDGADPGPWPSTRSPRAASAAPT